MVKKTKKNEIVVDGNKFIQKFNDIQFVMDYKEWKSHCEGISGSEMGVDETNVPTLYDFLENHIFNNVREGSKNAGADDGSNGAIEALSAIEDIMEDRVIYQSDIDNIKKLYKRMGQMQDNKGPDGLALDPKLILFTEKDSKGGKRKLYGHFATPEYIKRKKAKDSSFKGKAVDAGWYSGSGNPPSFALFSDGSSTYAKPKGLLYILDDAIKELDGPKGPTELELIIGRLKGRGAVDKLAGIASVERYFDKAINNEAFWRGGKLRVSQLAKDVATKSFACSPKEAEVAIAAMDTPPEKTPAGRIKSFKVELTGTPIILFIKAALERANKKQAGDEYRAWAATGEFDYRKTAREVYGEDTGRFRPDQKIISKSWMQILKQNFSESDIEDFVYSIEDITENVVAKMFKAKYEAGRHVFGDYIVHIRKTSLTVPEMAAVSNLAFKYEFEYDDGKDSLIFANCFIAGTDNGQINDLFFDASDSEFSIEFSRDFLKLPDVKERMAQVRNGFSELPNKV